MREIKRLNLIFFSAGSLTAHYNCQPVRTTGYDKLAILGGAKASGFWFAKPANTVGCIDGEVSSICGHYREWGGSPNDPAVKLGGTFPIDVAAHRQVCRAN